MIVFWQIPFSHSNKDCCLFILFCVFSVKKDILFIEMSVSEAWYMFSVLKATCLDYLFRSRIS